MDGFYVYHGGVNLAFQGLYFAAGTQTDQRNSNNF
jgi:hypothetical protein